MARYLATLQDELRNVDARVRDRVVREIAVRIAAGREDGGDVRTILAEIGDPLDVAAGVRELHGVNERSRWRDVAALVLLPFGGVAIPIAGWFAGIYFLWSSPSWTRRQKAVGTLVLPFGTLGPLVGMSWSSWLALLLALPFASVAYLALHLRG